MRKVSFAAFVVSYFQGMPRHKHARTMAYFSCDLLSQVHHHRRASVLCRCILTRYTFNLYHFIAARDGVDCMGFRSKPLKRESRAMRLQTSGREPFRWRFPLMSLFVPFACRTWETWKEVVWHLFFFIISGLAATGSSPVAITRQGKKAGKIDSCRFPLGCRGRSPQGVPLQ